MASEPERLYREWPVMGDAGECLHFATVPPVISENCIRVKDAIKNKRKFIIQEMMKQESNTSTHLLNENIRNLEYLMLTWESIHYNPPFKWNKSWINQLTPNVYRVFKKKSLAAHWRNSDYNLKSTKDFPPLDPPSDLIADYESFPFIASDQEKICLKTTFSSKIACVEEVQFPLKQQLEVEEINDEDMNNYLTIRKKRKSKVETSTSRNYVNSTINELKHRKNDEVPANQPFNQDSDKCSSKDDNDICQTKDETNNEDTNESSNNSLKDESETAEETAETAEEINDHLKTDTCFLNEVATTSTDNSLPLLEYSADCQVTEKESSEEEIGDISSKTEIVDFNEGENNENTDQETLNKISLSEDIQVDKTEAEITILNLIDTMLYGSNTKEIVNEKYDDVAKKNASSNKENPSSENEETDIQPQCEKMENSCTKEVSFVTEEALQNCICSENLDISEDPHVIL